MEMMKKEKIKEIALSAGFKTKKQPDGTWDLNPYVYDFAVAIQQEALKNKPKTSPGTTAETTNTGSGDQKTYNN